MDKCKWVLYRNASMWQTECSRMQGINVRPKQKKCFCGKRIERVMVDELCEADKAFIKILKGEY